MTKYFFLLTLLLVQSMAWSQSQARPCFRLEGLQMPCGGSIGPDPGGDTCQTSIQNACPGDSDPRLREVCRGQDVPGLSETIIIRCVGPNGEQRPDQTFTRACQGVKCCETCPTNLCHGTTVCRNTEWERQCPGTGIQPDCSQQSTCPVVVSTNTQTINSLSFCTAPNGTRRECGSPNRGAGENCTCSGACQPGPDNGACQYQGSSPGCTTPCTCGPGQLVELTIRLDYCEQGSPTQCIVTEQRPQVNDGQCGCRCPSPGGNLGLPACGGSSCSPSPRPPACRP